MSSPSTTSKPNGAMPENQSGVSILIKSQYLKDFSFENPLAPQTMPGGQPGPEISLKLDAEMNALGQENTYEVTLKIRAEAKQGSKTLFIVDMSYAGVFVLQGIPPEQHKPVLLIEGPRLLFPFARSILANATRDGGFPPLMLNPIDFADMFRRSQTPPPPGTKSEGESRKQNA